MKKASKEIEGARRGGHEALWVAEVAVLPLPALFLAFALNFAEGGGEIYGPSEPSLLMALFSSFSAELQMTVQASVSHI